VISCFDLLNSSKFLEQPCNYNFDPLKSAEVMFLPGFQRFALELHQSHGNPMAIAVYHLDHPVAAFRDSKDHLMATLRQGAPNAYHWQDMTHPE
jgi:hypothetical protein